MRIAAFEAALIQRRFASRGNDLPATASAHAMPRERRPASLASLALTVGSLVCAIAFLGMAQAETLRLDSQEVHATRLIGKFKATVADAIGPASVSQYGSAIARRYRLVPGLVLLDEAGQARPAGLPAGDESAARQRLLDRLHALRDSGLFEYVEPDHIMHLMLAPNDRAFVDGSLWGLWNYGQYGGMPGADIAAERAWDLTTGSTNVVVAVVDTGIRYTHLDLASQMWINANEIPDNGIDDDGNGFIDDIYGINALAGTGDPMDDHGHGTHCSGTIGAAANDGNRDRKSVV
mgnify:FL=1